MNRKRTATIVSASIATAAVAGGLTGRALLRRRRDRDDHPSLAELPPEDLGSVVSFDGTSVAVRAAGDPADPVIVFVHGFSLDMTTWHEQWTTLSDAFRCVLVDLRSHGRSGPAVNEDLSLETLAHDLRAVLDAVAPDRPIVLVGHSMGALAILSLAASDPGLFGPRVAGVVLIGAASGDLVRGAMGSVTELLRPGLGTVRTVAHRVNRLRQAVLASPGDVSGTIARLTQFGPDAPPHLVEHVVSLAARAPSHVWTDGLAGLMEADLRPALRHVSVPALVIVGQHDRVTPAAAAVRLVADLPKGSLATVENAGHMVMLERPSEVNDHVRAFAVAAFGQPPSGRRPSREPRGGEEPA
jgi:pimeloyl-ACP methyl ester carboxylesterase